VHRVARALQRKFWDPPQRHDGQRQAAPEPALRFDRRPPPSPVPGLKSDRLTSI
jgi:hypothetical protein